MFFPTATRRLATPLGILIAFLVPSERAVAENRFCSLVDLQTRFGFPEPTRITDAALTLQKPGWRLEFETNSRKVLFNGILVWMNAPMSRVGSKRIFSATDVDWILYPILTGRHEFPLSVAPRVMLDPGHGGSDTGATSQRLSEKKVTLDIALRTARLLREAGVTVLLTREKDRTTELAARTAKSTAQKASLFVSIHLNSGSNRDAEGLETYVLPAPGFPSTSGQGSDYSTVPGNRYDKASIRLAYRIHHAMLTHTRAPDRGIKRARFEVLKSAGCPAVLVECGFLSCPREELKLGDSVYVDKLAEGLRDGILSMVGEISIKK